MNALFWSFWNPFSRPPRRKFVSLVPHRLQGFALAALVIGTGGMPTLGLAGTEKSTTPPFAPVGDRVCVSVKELVRLMNALPAGAAVPNELITFAGLGWLEGACLDPERDDIILYGVRSARWPSLTIDDLVVHGRSLEGGYPYCSLDPTPASVQRLDALTRGGLTIDSDASFKKSLEALRQACGPQQVIIGNIPKNSRLAHLMVRADYVMKAASQKLRIFTNFPSCLDLALGEQLKAVRNGNPMPAAGGCASRFFFHVADQDPAFIEADGILKIERCAMILITEKQRAGIDGVLTDDGEQDPLALEWARRFSAALPVLSESEQDWGDLWNQYRLRALLLALKHRRLLDAGRFPWLQSFIDQSTLLFDRPLGPTRPGLANGRRVEIPMSRGQRRAVYILAPFVCGGVSLDISTNRHAPSSVENRLQLLDLKKRILARPPEGSLWWPLKA